MGTESLSDATVREQDLPTEELSEPDPPWLDVVFGTLKNARRRQVLRYVDEHSTTTQGELAEQIAAYENECPVEVVTSHQRKRVYVALYQSHLPKLDDAGAVSFDRNRGTVQRGPRLEEFLTYLDRVDEAEPDAVPAAAKFSLALALVLAVAVGVTFFSSLTLGAVVLTASLLLGVVLSRR